MTIQILLVEDDHEEATLFQEMLDLFGQHDRWQLHHVINGLEAIKFLKKETPYQNAPKVDIVFSDYNMPRMSGEEMLLDLHSGDWWKGYPVIVILTNYDFGAEKIKNLYQLGAASFIPKPKELSVFQKIFTYWVDCVELP